MSINVTPIPRLIDLAAPAFTLGTANAAGSADTAVASNSTLLVFDTTLPAPVGSAAVGSATVAPRRDHVHAGTTLAAPALTLGTANGAGSATTAFATDSTLLAFDTTLPAQVGTAAVGSATVAPRRDHVHAATTAPVFARVVRTSGDITTTSTSLTDVTGATVTVTTGAFPVVYSCLAFGNNSTTGSNVSLNVDLDGALQLGSDGQTLVAAVGGSHFNMSFSGQTAALSAGSHVLKMRWRVGSNTGTIKADSYGAFVWSVFEIR